MSRDYTGLSPSLVCTWTRDEHDFIVNATGRPLTQDPMAVKSAGLPDTATVSLIDTYVNDSKGFKP